MVNKKLLLGLIFIGGLQNLNCIAPRAAHAARTASFARIATALRHLNTHTAGQVTQQQAQVFERQQPAPQAAAATAPVTDPVTHNIVKRTNNPVAAIDYELLALETEIAALQQQLQAGTNREATLNQEIANLQGQIVTLQQQLQAGADQITTLQQQLLASTQREAAFNKQIENLNKQLDNLITAYEELAQKFIGGQESANDEIKTLKNKIANLRGTIAQSKITANALIQASDESIKQLTERAIAAELELTKKEKHIERIQMLYKILEEVNENLDIELRNSKAKTKFKIQENEIFKEKIEILKKIVAVLKTKPQNASPHQELLNEIEALLKK